MTSPDRKIAIQALAANNKVIEQQVSEVKDLQKRINANVERLDFIDSNDFMSNAHFEALEKYN